MSLKNQWILFGLVIFLTGFFVYFSIPYTLAEKIGIPYPNWAKPFRLGLDLKGGVSLLYEIDTSGLAKDTDQKEAVQALRNVIEKRVNLMGVEEPVVQILGGKDNWRLKIELPGMQDPQKAIEEIGKTPVLEFREEMTQEEKDQVLKELESQLTKEQIEQIKDQPIFFKPTKLTGQYLKGAKIEFNPNTYQPYISLEFTKEGAEIFRDLTKRNIEKQIAIYVDNNLISAPVVQEEISGGRAQITGQFTIEEAKELAQNLNAGALPLPIHNLSSKVIGPTLGKTSVDQSLKAGLIGLFLIFIFLILVYRFSGLLASISLVFYLSFLLTIFKLIPVTLTLSGIAGFLVSLGMAVDVNVLTFERLREEKRDKEIPVAIQPSFARSWPAVKDGNFTTLITCAILFFISTGFIQGFALTLGLGVILGLFSGMLITRLFMDVFASTRLGKFERIWSR